MSTTTISPLSVAIRLATGEDTPAIIRIVNTAFALEEFFEGDRTDEKRIAVSLQKGRFLVAEHEGRVVASIYVELRGERGYMGMLAIDPAWQGHGLGRRMAKTAEDFLRQHGCQYADIVVLSLRPELLPYYRKVGYQEMGTEEFHSVRPLKNGLECHLILLSKAL